MPSIPNHVHTVDITTGAQVQLSSTLESTQKFKEESPFSEVDNLSYGQETPQRLWKTKVQYDGHEVPTMYPVLVLSITIDQRKPPSPRPFVTFDKTLVSLRYEAVSSTHKSKVKAYLLVG